MAVTLVITGMHRSGTSLLASAAQRAGVDIGSELNPATRGNLRGHFEDVGFLHFHERFMERRSVPVFSPAMDWTPRATPEEEAEARKLVARQAGKPLWGFKDPRTALFLDFWDPLLPNPFYLFVFRHPVEVVLSLAASRARSRGHPRLLECHAGLASLQLASARLPSRASGPLCALAAVRRGRRPGGRADRSRRTARRPAGHRRAERSLSGGRAAPGAGANGSRLAGRAAGGSGSPSPPPGRCRSPCRR